MKKILLLVLSAIIFSSCSKSQEEILIANHVQTLGDTKMDLGFKLINFEKVSETTAKDSLKIFNEYFISKRDEKIKQFEDEIEYKTKEVEINREALEKEKNQILKDLYKTRLETAIADIDRLKNSIELYQGDCKGTFLESILENIKTYESKGDEVLLKKFKVQYSVKNPLLGNAKQEVNKYFYFDGNSSKVISTSSE